MTYKVLRLLEYTYVDVDEAERDMQHWQVPSSGTKRFSAARLVRSALIQYPEVKDDSSNSD